VAFLAVELMCPEAPKTFDLRVLSLLLGGRKEIEFRAIFAMVEFDGEGL
jgi:hypothetical protein